MHRTTSNLSEDPCTSSCGGITLHVLRRYIADECHHIFGGLPRIEVPDPVIFAYTFKIHTANLVNVVLQMLKGDCKSVRVEGIKGRVGLPGRPKHHHFSRHKSSFSIEKSSYVYINALHPFHRPRVYVKLPPEPPPRRYSELASVS